MLLKVACTIEKLVYYLKGSNRYSCFHQYLFKKLECQGGNLDLSFDEKKNSFFKMRQVSFRSFLKWFELWPHAIGTFYEILTCNSVSHQSKVICPIITYMWYSTNIYECNLKFQHLLSLGTKQYSQNHTNFFHIQYSLTKSI